MALIQCPSCGRRFDPWQMYTVEEVASMLMVSPKTVKFWMYQKRLGFRVRPLGGKRYRRLVDGSQLMAYLDTYWSVPSEDPNSTKLGDRAWRRMVELGSLGGKASAAARRAARQAQATSNPDVITPDSAQDPKS
jgi:Helix-turn-helix domain